MASKPSLRRAPRNRCRPRSPRNRNVVNPSTDRTGPWPTSAAATSSPRLTRSRLPGLCLRQPAGAGACAAGKFAVTAELNPPDSADPDDVFEAARPLGEVADAINATDASGANCHMSSIGICSLLTRAGYGNVYQISCRDRNRIAIQGDVLGAAAMGVSNVLCLTGDGVGVGDQPGAKPVFDFDSLSLLRTIKTMRDRRHCFSRDARSSARLICFWAPPRTRASRPMSGAPNASPRRSRRVRSSSRPITSTTCRCSRSSWCGSARSRPGQARVHPGRRRPAGLGEGRALDALERARHSHSGRGYPAHGRGPRSRARKASGFASS